MPGRTQLALFAALLVATVVFIVHLGRAVMSDLEALATAPHDNVSWNISQLEVELLSMRRAATQALPTSDETLSELRKRYDVFYSRVFTLSESTHFDAIRDEPAVQTGLAAAMAFLTVQTPIIDGSDAQLQSALPAFLAQADRLQPPLRALALSGIQKLAEQDAARRASLSHTLWLLAVALLGLIVLLIMAMAVLVRLYRHDRRLSRANQIARARFEAAVTSSLDAVLVIDTSGHVIEFNGAAETVFGYSRAETIGIDMADLIVPPHMREMHRKGMQRFLDTGEKKVIGAGRVRLEGMRKSGECFPVELSISLSEAGGERVFVSFLRDITPEIEAEEALRTARDKAQESEKAKSNLLTVMSHEMRTPLNGILGSLSLIERDTLSPRQKRHLESISVSGELLLSHVNDVLDLSSLTSEARPREVTRFALHDLIGSVAESLHANAQARGNEIRTTFLSAGPDIVRADKTALQQCLINLVGNAVKFTSNGQITIELERLDADDLVEIRVSDTGVGIAPDNLDRIFEEFVTVDTAFARENAGTGLGLAITRRLVERMQGTIEADSEPGEGSMFTIRLPLPPAPGALAQAHAPAPRLDVPQGLHALVVDDNEINRMILTDMLKNMGFTVDQASDGFGAIDKVAQQHFDVLLLDISMPGIDGIETLHRVRALDVAWKDLPAIAVTAHAAPQDHAHILKAPFAKLLVKPVHGDQLRSLLAEVLAPTETTSSAPPPSLKPETPANDFRARFGEEKYQGALRDLHEDTRALLDGLTPDSAPSSDARAQAHKLAGSAAILGENALWELLQELEHTPPDITGDAHTTLQNALRAQIPPAP